MALPGVTLEISLARFMASMAASSKERALSRRFCRLEVFASVVEGRRSIATRKLRGAEIVRKDPNLDTNANGRPFCHDKPRANSAI